MELTHVSLDSYYHGRSAVPNSADGDPNFDHPDAIDWELFVDHVTALANSAAVMMPRYDFHTHASLQERQSSPRRSSSSRGSSDSIIIPGGTNPAAIDLLREKVKTETDARTLVADASD